MIDICYCIQYKSNRKIHNRIKKPLVAISVKKSQSFPNGEPICARTTPGSRDDVKDLLAALRSGTLTRRQLEQNAARVIRKAQQLCAGR